MERILIPIDGSADSLQGVDAARRLLLATPQDAPVDIHLLNVQPRMTLHIARHSTLDSRRKMRETRAQAALAPAFARLEGLGRVRGAMRIGDVCDGIVGYAREHRVTRIVMGTSRKNLLERLTTGSIVNRVIAEADVPVMVAAGRRPGLLERYGVPAGVGLGLSVLILGID
jgi:nucleotide-binding universal stress UspA family protein